MSIKANNLIVRCYAEKKDGQWQAFCLDFCLAAQGDSVKDVKKKLNQITLEYIVDALVGEDKKYARQLLNRRAPFKFWLKYYYYKVLHFFHSQRKKVRLFDNPLPMIPDLRNHNHA